jgi:hypothetical protein
LLGYAVAKGRLPCPASATSNGVESETVVGNGVCTNPYDGFLPAVTLGFQPADSQGFALDAWNNRIRYAVAQTIENCSGTNVTPHFTSKANLKQNGMSCLPTANNDIIICQSSVSSPVPTAGTGNCGPANYVNAVTYAGSVVAVVFSAGKNYAQARTAAAATTAGKFDEAANLDGNIIFINHTPTPAGATGGEFDDLMVWIPVGLFYGRLASAGVLP